jgi:hypothetical protein
MAAPAADDKNVNNSARLHKAIHQQQQQSQGECTPMSAKLRCVFVSAKSPVLLPAAIKRAALCMRVDQ